MSIFQYIAEQRIQEAYEKGEFDNLRGYGKPIDNSTYFSVPAEERMAVHIMKNAGIVPKKFASEKELVRAYSTNSLHSYSFSEENHTLILNVSGHADVATTAKVFTETEKGIASQLIMIHAHDGPFQIPVILKGSRVFPEQNERLPEKMNSTFKENDDCFKFRKVDQTC